MSWRALIAEKAYMSFVLIKEDSKESIRPISLSTIYSHVLRFKWRNVNEMELNVALYVSAQYAGTPLLVP
jgi:hypothetical protein